MTRLRALICSRLALVTTTVIGVIVLYTAMHLHFRPASIEPRSSRTPASTQFTGILDILAASRTTQLDARVGAERGSNIISGVKSTGGNLGVKSDASSVVRYGDANSGVRNDAGPGAQNEAVPGVKLNDAVAGVKNDAVPGVKLDNEVAGVKNDAVAGVKNDAVPGVKLNNEVAGVKLNDAVAGVKHDAVPGVKLNNVGPDVSNGFDGSAVGREAGSAAVKSDVRSGVKPEAVSSKINVSPKELCPERPPINDTKMPLNLTKMNYEGLKQAWGHVMQQGGHYAPSTCQSRERTAIIIPYRDRQANLHVLLNNLIPFLIRQQADFTVFLVEQTEDYLFNRCLMFNVGFVESAKHGKFSCFILHDTDLIPRDFRNLYRCGPQPRHLMLSRSNENWKEVLPYPSFIGGVLALRRDHIEKSNGCSNSYYGWGVEDDDLEIRLKTHGFRITRFPVEIGGYYSLGHAQQSSHANARSKLVKTIRQRKDIEGLNTLNYTLVHAEKLDLYTWLLVKPPPPPSDIYGAS